MHVIVVALEIVGAVLLVAFLGLAAIGAIILGGGGNPFQ